MRYTCKGICALSCVAVLLFFHMGLVESLQLISLTNWKIKPVQSSTFICVEHNAVNLSMLTLCSELDAVLSMLTAKHGMKFDFKCL